MRTAVEKALEELVDVVPAGVDGFIIRSGAKR